MARNFEGTTFSRLPGHYARLINAKVTKSVLWEIVGPYSLGSNDRNGLVHILTETFQRDTGDQASFGDDLRVAIQKRQHFFLHIDILASDTKYYSLDP